MKLKLKPILNMIIVTVTVAISIYFIIITLQSTHALNSLSSWIIADLVHIPQFLIPFIIIIKITKGNLSLYGFNFNEDPPEFTHKRMLIIGICSGLIMSIKYLNQILNGLPIEIPRPVTISNILGYMTFQWIIVGLSEETMFRGLIQTYLMKNLEGELTFSGHKLHIGTILSAIFWGGFHIINALNMPLNDAINTVLITTPIGLLMGYAYQRTGSILTTILVHNFLFGVPLTVGYMLYFIGY